MNFEHMPELQWGSGYLYFWIMAIVLTLLQLAYFRRIKWI